MSECVCVWKEGMGRERERPICLGDDNPIFYPKAEVGQLHLDFFFLILIKYAVSYFKGKLYFKIAPEFCAEVAEVEGLAKPTKLHYIPTSVANAKPLEIEISNLACTHNFIRAREVIWAMLKPQDGYVGGLTDTKKNKQTEIKWEIEWSLHLMLLSLLKLSSANTFFK